MKRPVPNKILLHNLGQLAGLVTFGHFFQGNDLDFRRLAFAAEGLETRAHDRFGGGAGWFQEVARVEFRRVLEQEFTRRRRHRQTDVGVDVDLAHAMPYAFLDFLDRHAVGFLHVAAEFADDGQQLLRHRRGTVHHQVGVGDARVDFLDAVDGEDVAGRLAGELVGAVRGADGDGQRVALGALDEVGGLLDVGQQLLAGHGAVGAVAVFLVAHHGFQRTEHAQFRFHGDADGVRELDHFARHFDVVIIRGDRLAVRFERAVHHHNVEVSREVVKFSHAIGVTVEAELGVLGSLETMMGDKEDGHGADGAMTREQLLTDVQQAADFVQRTQCDALAIAIGTSHGAYKFTRKPTGDILAIDRIKEIHARIPNTHLVMHGSSSVPQELLAIIREFGGDMKETYGVPVEEIQEGIRHGVRKINIDTDIRLAMTAATRKFLFESPSKFDPRDFLKPARAAAEAVVRARFQAFGCEGQASKIKVIPLEKMAERYKAGELAQIVK